MNFILVLTSHLTVGTNTFYTCLWVRVVFIISTEVLNEPHTTENTFDLLMSNEL